MFLVVALLLAQVQPTKVCDPSVSSKCVTTTTSAGKQLLDVNVVLGGGSSPGGSGGGTIDGGNVGVSSLPLVFIGDAGVLNVNPVAIASMPTVNIADAGTLNVNFPASQTVNGTVTVLQGPGQDGGVWQIAITGPLFIGDAGVLNVNFPASQAVTGAFWQAVQNINVVDAGPPLNVNPVAIASLPLVFIADAGTLNINLPPGAATAARQDTGNISLANLDVALSTRTKPADQQHTIIDSSATVPVSLATAPTTPITAVTLPLPAFASTDATLSQLLDGGVGLLSTIATAEQTNGVGELTLIRRTAELQLLEMQQVTLLLQKIAGAYPGANP